MIDLKKLDDETFQLMKKYCGSLERRIIKIDVPEQWSGVGWTLNEFNDKYQKAIDQIPHESRSNAIVELDGGYDGSLHFAIYYYRLETIEEWNERMDEALKYAEEKKRSELAQYQRLKDKYDR